MADKKHNLNIGDQVITVPAWATESTMEQVVGYMAATNKVDQKFLTLMKGMGSDVKGLQQAISQVVTAVNTDSKTQKDIAKNEQKLAKGITGVGKSVLKVSSFFGNAEKPLTSMVGAAGDLIKGMRGLDTGFTQRFFGAGTKLGEFFEKFGGAIGDVADVGLDAALAYAGWNAAKFEQFAEAQKKAIDAGAIFYSSGAAFDDLYSRSLDAGVTYNAMLDTVSQFGGAMVGLGGDVSRGASDFVDLFGELNVAMNAFGDLGMSSNEMMGAYAEYLDYARRSGFLNRKLAEGGDALQRSFVNLQIEASGLANLTALSKSEAMRRQMQALTDPLLILGTRQLEESGLPDRADVVRAVASQLGLFSEYGPELQGLLDSFNREIAETGSNVGNFDIRRKLDTAMVANISELIGPNFLNDLNNLVRSGTMTAEEAKNFIMDSLLNAKEQVNVSSGSQSEIAQRQLALATEIMQIKQDFAGMAGLTQEEREARMAATTSALGQAGRATVQMNDATTMFLQVQDAMTLPMQDTAEIFDDISAAMRRSANLVKEFFGFGGGDEEDNGGDTEIESEEEFGGPDGFGSFFGDGPVAGVNGFSSPGFTGPDPNTFSAIPRTDTTLNLQPGDPPSNTGSGTQTIDDVAAPVPSADNAGAVIQNQRNAGTRTQGLDEQLLRLLSKAGEEAGVSVHVGSGGQPSQADVRAAGGRQDSRGRWNLDAQGRQVRTGSTRHDHGMAADLSLGVSDGNGGTRFLSMTSQQDMPIITRFLTAAREFGATGIGAGDFQNGRGAYMGDKTFHVGYGGTAMWGDDGETTNTPDFLIAIQNNSTLGGRESEIRSRRFGGNVTSGMPYLVGDNLGLSSAELFVPESNGRIINNEEVQTMIKNMASSVLTNSGMDSSIVDDLSSELDSVIESKQYLLSTMQSLNEAITQFNMNKNRRAKIDLINSA